MSGFIYNGVPVDSITTMKKGNLLCMLSSVPNLGYGFLAQPDSVLAQRTDFSFTNAVAVGSSAPHAIFLPGST